LRWRFAASSEESMNVNELLTLLESNPNSGIQMVLPDQSSVPAHFHVTEVGRVQKDFIDCGGKVRSATTCVLQAWVAHDLDHRLEARKLAAILRQSQPLLKSTELPVEVEYEQGVISQYPLERIEVTEPGLVLHLGTKHTACLATELCILDSCC
jgi:Family of unknown function (DUF6428)